ncbi:MAG: alpha/beta fold hydrolase [Betaproteobacteria bacterium]|nr:alpha/beta fold hydrolase [Betaproteobacteria bacterium]
MVRQLLRRVARTRMLGWGLASLIIAGTLAGCASLAEKERELIFRPVKDEWRGYRSSGANFQELWIPVAPTADNKGDKLHAWWAPGPTPDAPVLLYLHGARWNLTGSVTRIPRWQRMGFAVLAIDYRGFGKSEGDMPSEASAYADAQAAWDHIRTLSPNARRYLHGHSLGGAIAVEMARRNPDANGLILEATFTSIPDMVKEMKWGWLPVGFLITQRFDSLDKIDDVKVPTLFLHGTNDAIVPVTMSQRLYAAAKAPKKLVIVEGGTHHNLTSMAYDNVRAAVAELFQPTGAAGVSAATQ